MNEQIQEAFNQVKKLTDAIEGQIDYLEQTDIATETIKNVVSQNIQDIGMKLRAIGEYTEQL